MTVVFVSYSLKQISDINDGIENKEWVEYSGRVFFDSGKNRLNLLDNESSIPLFGGKDKNGIINNNFVNIPAGYSEGYIVYLKKSKAVVLFVPADSLPED